MSTEKLMPCPFCGGKAVLTIGFDPLRAAFVDCPSCRASGRIFEASEDAVTHWNRQAALQSQSIKDSNLMLSAVIRMPFEQAMATELTRLQFYQRAQQALNKLEAIDHAHRIEGDE